MSKAVKKDSHKLARQAGKLRVLAAGYSQNNSPIGLDKDIYAHVAEQAATQTYHKNKWNIPVPDTPDNEVAAKPSGDDTFIFWMFILVFCIGAFLGGVIGVGYWWDTNQKTDHGEITFSDYECMYDWLTVEEDLSTIHDGSKIVKGPGIRVKVTCEDHKFLPYIGQQRARGVMINPDNR